MSQHKKVGERGDSISGGVSLLLQKQADLFQGLSLERIEPLLSSSRICSVDRGAVIIKQGDTVKYLYLLIEGSVRLYRTNRTGKEVSISMLKAGDTFMESVLFMDGPSPVRAKALNACKFFLVPAATLRQQIRNERSLGTNLLRIIARHYQNAIQQIESVATKPPLDRLGYYLLKLYMEQNPHGPYVDLLFPKTSIASHLGMTPETFSRSIRKLRALGIELDYKRILIRKEEALCRFCDQDIAAICPKKKHHRCYGPLLGSRD
ncbi:MAG: Crp/Fnr family transcriptional regulator [Pseudomonadales bacterium]